jgi:hypothetical protein
MSCLRGKTLIGGAQVEKKRPKALSRRRGNAAYLALLAAARAVMLSTRRTVAAGVRM